MNVFVAFAAQWLASDSPWRAPTKTISSMIWCAASFVVLFLFTDLAKAEHECVRSGGVSAINCGSASGSCFWLSITPFRVRDIFLWEDCADLHKEHVRNSQYIWRRTHHGGHKPKLYRLWYAASVVVLVLFSDQIKAEHGRMLRVRTVLQKVSQSFFCECVRRSASDEVYSVDLMNAVCDWKPCRSLW